MKKLIKTAVALSVAFASVTSHAQSFGHATEQTDSQQTAPLRLQIAQQKKELDLLHRQLTQKRLARNGIVAVTVASGVVAVLAAIPGIVVLAGGAKNLANNVNFMGDPDSGGTIMIPVVIATTAASAGAAFGTYEGYKSIQMRDSDIKALTAKVEAKMIEVNKAYELLQSME